MYAKRPNIGAKQSDCDALVNTLCGVTPVSVVDFDHLLTDANPVER